VQLGAGGGYHDSFGEGGGVLLGGGYRYEMDRWAIDIGSTLLIPTNEDSRFFHFEGSLKALRFIDEKANNTLYAGGGVGVGVGGGFGLEGSAIVGYEMFRAANVRLFIQGALTLPVHNYESWADDYVGGYMPYGSLSLGFAFKPPERNVISIF